MEKKCHKWKIQQMTLPDRSQKVRALRNCLKLLSICGVYEFHV